MGLYADLRAPRSLDLASIEPQVFVGADGREIAIEHPLTRALVHDLAQRFPASATIPQLERRAVTRVQREVGVALARQSDEMSGELAVLIASGALGIVPPEPAALNPPTPAAILDTWTRRLPQATRLARAEAAEGALTSIRHRSLRIEPLDAALVQALDGTMTTATLLQSLNASGGNDAGTLSEHGLQERLFALARLGVLEAPRGG